MKSSSPQPLVINATYKAIIPKRRRSEQQSIEEEYATTEIN